MGWKSKRRGIPELYVSSSTRSFLTQSLEFLGGRVLPMRFDTPKETLGGGVAVTGGVGVPGWVDLP
eukprot:763020-Hanusia_phi.AAC.6